jgi:hypothetical protein
MATPSVWTVTTTTPTEDAARSIARAAVTEKLAAGAFITGPIKSVFWHLGESGGPLYRGIDRLCLYGGRVPNPHPVGAHCAEEGSCSRSS